MADPVLHGLTRVFAHGRGFTQIPVVPNPAAGGGFTYRIDSRYWQRLASVAFKLVTDGTAGNRTVTLAYVDQDGNVLAKVGAGGTQAANLTRYYTFLPNISVPQAVAADAFLSPLPDLFLQPEHALVIVIDTVKAGDAITAVRIEAECFDTGQEGFPLGMVEVSAATGRAERRSQ